MPRIHVTAIAFLLVFSNFYSQEKRMSRSAQKNYTYQITIEETPENDEKTAELGFDILNAIHKGKIEEYMALYDTKTFRELIFNDLKSNKNTDPYKESFLKGIEQGATALPSRLISEVEGDSYYDFVNYGYNLEQKTYYILFRLYSIKTGLNYHEYRVSKINEKFMFNDIYIHLSGETLSKTYNRLYLYGLPKDNLFDLFGSIKAKAFLKMTKAVQLYQQKNYNEAYHTFNSIEGDLENDRFILILKTMCASHINNDEYKKSMKQIMEQYPNDASLNLSQIDYYTLNKEHDTAINLINDIEQNTQDDFLNLLKGNIEYDRGNFEKALEYFKYITTAYPDFFIGHTSYLSCLTAMQDFTACSEFLNFLVNEGYAKKDLVEFIEELDENGKNELQQLITSESYQNWKKQL